MAPFSNYPIPQGVKLSPTVKLVDSNLPILGVASNGSVVTAIVYGQPGETGRLTLALAGQVKAGSLSPAFTADPVHTDQVHLKITIPASGVEEDVFNQGDQTIRILAVNQDLSLYTWILGAARKQYVVFGPAYVQDIEQTGKKLAVTVERYYGQPSSGQVAVYGGKNESWHLGVKADTGIESVPAPALENWQMAGTKEITADYDDSKWKQSDEPLQMGADGDTGAFAWYRTTFDVPAAGRGTLTLVGGGQS